MKKRRQKKAILGILMRITVLQIVFIGMFVGGGYAHDSHAQEILDKRVSLSVMDQGIEYILEKIEQQADVRFVYSYEVIKAGRKMSLDIKNQRLETVLATLLVPLKIDYKVSNRKTIILKRTLREGCSAYSSRS